MAHTPQLSPEMAEQALDAHCSILVDSTHSKDAERKVYIGKCVEDIKKVTHNHTSFGGHFTVAIDCDGRGYLTRVE